MAMSLDKSKISQFSTLVEAGIAAWAEAGKILVSLVDSSEDAYAEILASVPWMTLEVLKGFERIGRREVLPQLIVDHSAGARHLAKLPYRDQEKLINAEFEVLALGGSERAVKLRLQSLTPKQVSILFDGHRVRTIEEQKAKERKITGFRDVPTARTSRNRRLAGCDWNDGDGDTEKLGPEIETPESLDADPTETFDGKLQEAQSALIRAREILLESGGTDKAGYFDAALKAIGTMRFKAQEQLRAKQGRG